MLLRKWEIPVLKLHVPFQLSEVQFNVYFTDWPKGCAVRSPSGKREYGVHEQRRGIPGPACCHGGAAQHRGACASATPVSLLQSPSQAGTAGLGQNATPLLSAGSFCHVFLFGFSQAHLCCTLTAEGGGSGSSLGLCRGAWPLPSTLRQGKEFSCTFHFGRLY